MDLVNIKCLERLKEGEGNDREMVGWHHRFNGVEFGQTPESVMDREAWRAPVCEVAKSRTGLRTELN